MWISIALCCVTVYLYQNIHCLQWRLVENEVTGIDVQFILVLCEKKKRN